MVKNAYIHIPFCKSKCKYCSFVSFPKIEMKEKYLQALVKEIKHHYKAEMLDTIYFGGGTPSLLKIDEFETLLNLFNFSENSEITAEINPETVTQKYLNNLKSTGINRLSIGCQTFDNDILKIIGRLHNAEQVENVVKFAQKANFDNISIDFIYGLPNQTAKMFENDLKHAISLGIQHISLYGLKIDEGCHFYTRMPENLPDEDIQADMYLKAIEVLKNYEHYEISNFGKASRHNLNYWNNNNYYGFGVSAHGYIENIRYCNTSNIEDYLKNPIQHSEETFLSEQEQLEEEIFLGFRKMDGIDIANINDKFNIDFDEKYKKIIKKYKNYIKKTEKGYAFNTNGILISNTILAEFLQ